MQKEEDNDADNIRHDKLVFISLKPKVGSVSCFAAGPPVWPKGISLSCRHTTPCTM